MDELEGRLLGLRLAIVALARAMGDDARDAIVRFVVAGEASVADAPPSAGVMPELHAIEELRKMLDAIDHDPHAAPI